MVKVVSQRFQKSFGLFTMLLVEGSSEVDFLNIYLTTFLGVRKFKNTSAMRVIFSLKMLKIECKFQKHPKKNIHKMFFVSEITVTGNVVINCLC